MVLMRNAAAFILAVSIAIPGVAVAARDDFDIDLKELRNIAHQGVAKKQQIDKPQPAPEPVAAVSGDESVYVVQPGDHLFKILIRQYGLSDPAAERLIPEVMSLNGVASPKSLKVGQRLRIPLAARNGNLNKTVHAATRKTNQEPTETQTPRELPAPSAGINSISILAAPPCELAQTLTKKLGLQAASRLKGKDIFRAVNGDRNITVACNLSRAEQYSYDRIVTFGHGKLLTFDGNESTERVVEQLTDSLNLAVQKHDPESNRLPLTYTFAPFGSWSREVLLTILPALSTTTSPDATVPGK